MKRSAYTLRSIFQITYCKISKIAALCLIGVLMLTFSGCGTKDVTEIHLAKQDHDFDLEPTAKKDGSPFSIAFMDLGPPIESSYLCLKGFVEGMQECGYISDKVELTKAPDEFFAYYDYVKAQNLGKYITFCDEPFMIDEGDNTEIADALKEKTANGEIDIVVATGTDPGLFLKDLDLSVPFLVCLATDPVGSGIIDSADNTGDPDIWALVEENPYQRQFAGYQSMFDFDKIGFVSVEEYDLIAGNSEYRKAAKDLGVELDEISFTEEETMADDFDEKFLQRLNDTQMYDYDAILFAYGTMDDDNAAAISKLLASRNVPSLISDGDSISQNGGMMCLSCFDYEGYGNYAALVVSNIFHGKKAGDQPCRFSSSPHIVFNMTTAEATGFETNFDFLQTVDRIYR